VSSAFLYLAIIAIWAGVLVPRWLKRDSSRPKAAKSSQPESPHVAESPEAAESPDELTDDKPVEVTDGAVAGGAEVHMPEANTDADAGADRIADAGRTADTARDAGRGRAADAGCADAGPADPRTRQRILSARRRMLMMLIVLAVAAAGIAVTGLAAWWVAVPPVAMLGGYMLLLREIRHADAERALIRAHAEQQAEQQRLREAREAREALEAAAARQREQARREQVQTARIIDISQRVRDELYDQYAEGERRAVGD